MAVQSIGTKWRWPLFLLSPVPCPLSVSSLFPVPCSLLPVSNFFCFLSLLSVFPVLCSLLLVPCSLFPTFLSAFSLLTSVIFPSYLSFLLPLYSSLSSVVFLCLFPSSLPSLPLNFPSPFPCCLFSATSACGSQVPHDIVYGTPLKSVSLPHTTTGSCTAIINNCTNNAL